MVTEFLIQSGIKIFEIFSGLIPFTFDFSFDISAINTFMEIVSTATYFFPWSYVSPILLIIVGLMSFRISIALIRFVLSFIPFMGS